MIHKAWNGVEEVPYCFTRSSVKFQGHTGQKNRPNWALPCCCSSLNKPMVVKWCTKLDVAYKRCPIPFKVMYQISGSHGTKNFRFWPKLGISGLQPKFESTNGCEMMHKVSSSIDKEPWCFLRSSVKFQGLTEWKMPILTRNGRFRTISQVSIDWCLRNDVQRLEWFRRGFLGFFFKVIHRILKSHWTKSRRFSPKLNISGL